VRFEEPLHVPQALPRLSDQPGRLAGRPVRALQGFQGRADLLGPGRLAVLSSESSAAHWRTLRTDDNTAGTGIDTVCQQDRFADPHGYAALVRRSTTGAGRSAVQAVEVSRSPAEARRTLRTALGWWAGCQLARLRLTGSARVTGVGDEARVLTFHRATTPARTYSVAVARTGQVTSTLVVTSAHRAPAPSDVLSALALSVSPLCGRDGRVQSADVASAGCVRSPGWRPAPLPSVGGRRGVLEVVDLPPVAHLTRPWAGTVPRAVPRSGPSTGHGNPAATTCDAATFADARAVRSRTFVVPGARVPARFGLAETYGVFRTPHAAARFLDQVRHRFAACEHRDLAARVSPEQRGHDVSRWRLTTKVSEHEAVRFRVGFVRVGDAVAELTFTPTPGADLTDATFAALVDRAGRRLSGVASASP
jgi:hypothetical protein